MENVHYQGIFKVQSNFCNFSSKLYVVSTKSLPSYFLSPADFFQNQLFGKIISGIPSECQTDWVQIRPDILSGLIWVQSVCKGYEQMTIVD